MGKDILKLFGLSVLALLVAVTVYDCGSSGGGGGPSGPTVSLTFSPTSGTIGAVDLNSMFYENIATSIGKTTGAVDPTSVQIGITPALGFTMTMGFSNGKFAGYVDIVPTGFLTAGTSYSVATQFKTTINNKVYPVTQYSSFTTVTSSGSPAAPGGSFFINITGVSQPSTLASVLAGGIPNIAISIITETTAVSKADADGSMILYGGEANGNVPPTDIKPSGFTLPLVTQYRGEYFKSAGSVTFNVSHIPIPLQTFDLSGTFNAAGGIDNGTLYAVLHCTDTQCSNLGSTAGSIVAQYIDSNLNMAVLGTFTGTSNAVPAESWIGVSDTTVTTLVNGAGPASTATLKVTTTTSGPLTTTSTLSFIMLTQTDSNNMLSIAADGQGSLSFTGTGAAGSPYTVTIAYPLVTPDTGVQFTTSTGTPYTAYYLFGLTPSLTTQFTP
ncbi:MAG: hypothetical protein M1517_05030 [Deltaproteobacteria bacterium]|nr:hypothetical protein [Deltaproteobacteria bacterium]